MGSSYLSSYSSLGLLLLVGVALAVAAFAANRLLRTQAPSVAKETTYECGLDPVGDDWAQVRIRYYVYAFLYVLFAVESLFLFPWAVIFDTAGYGIVTVTEMGIFVAVLALGLAYAWRKGGLAWV